MPFMNDKPFRKDLSDLLARDVRIGNDANCMALAEAMDGAGNGSNTVSSKNPKRALFGPFTAPWLVFVVRRGWGGAYNSFLPP